jgi:hypothetical protein
MNKKIVLLIDSTINLILGILLLAFSPFIINLLGVPPSENYFYPNILGGIFIGITIALIIEALRKNSNNNIGLGLMGAICINICGGIVLLLWLLFGDLDIPLKGLILLWILDIILLIISSVELFINLKGKKKHIAEHGQ